MEYQDRGNQQRLDIKKQSMKRKSLRQIQEQESKKPLSVKEPFIREIGLISILKYLQKQNMRTESRWEL